MKRIVSISLGSSKRDHRVVTEVLGEEVVLERIGTDGSLKRALALLRDMDGNIDAFGIGGIDIYIQAGQKKYMLRDGKKMAEAVTKTPIVDGSGLKNTLERKVIRYLADSKLVSFAGRRVLMVCAVDRFGMAEELVAHGAELTVGDLIFGLGIPCPINSLKTLDRVARVIAPAVSMLPTKFIYPSGSPEKDPKPKFARFYLDAEIIAGDYHYIKKHLPNDISGRIIITNTVTSEDVNMLQQRGASKLVTTTPELNGRSFGTNVMEALLVALLQKRPAEIKPQEYASLLDRIGFHPRVLDFEQKDDFPTPKIQEG